VPVGSEEKRGKGSKGKKEKDYRSKCRLRGVGETGGGKGGGKIQEGAGDASEKNTRGSLSCGIDRFSSRKTHPERGKRRINKGRTLAKGEYTI